MMTSQDHAQTVTRNPAQWALWRRWVAATTAGEFLGFGIPALIGALAVAVSLPDSAILVIMPLAGLGEGAVLGLAQWLVLRQVLPVSGRAWTLATGLAAVLAYIIGLLPANAGDLGRLHPALLAVVGLGLGALFLVSIGEAQWLVLRRTLPRAGSWIAANAIAWPQGVAVPVIALSLIPDGAPAVAWLVVGLASGLLMGGIVGAITGLALLRLLDGRALPTNAARPWRTGSGAAGIMQS